MYPLKHKQNKTDSELARGLCLKMTKSKKWFQKKKTLAYGADFLEKNFAL